MDRLSIILSLLTGAAITGIVVITAFTLGFYNWWAVGAGAVIGWLLAWPVAYLISRRIKQNDKAWEPPHAPEKHAPIPPANAREV